MARTLTALISRHGSTVLNESNSFRSMLDPALDEKGMSQAERLADVISKKYKVYKIISSPMLRAVQTADIISEKIGVKVKQDRGLLPWHLGILGGRDKDEYDHLLEYYIDNPKQAVPDGQSLDDFEERVEEFFKDELEADYHEAPIGTEEGGYSEEGPFHCEDCIHKTSPDKPYCTHSKIINSFQMKDRIVKIGGKRVATINLQRGCCEYVKPHEDTEQKVRLYISHTSVLVSLENLCHGNRDGRPEAGEESVGPGGLAEIYSTDDGYDIVPVLEDQPAAFGE